MTRKRKTQPAARADAPPRAVVYTRLSRSKSGTDRADAERRTEATLQTQQAGCERHIAALGGVVVALEHDVASGDRLDVRHGLFRALERIASGEADTLIVYALDRLSRDSVQQAGIVQELRKHDAALLSATETVEDGPFGDLMRAVYAFGAALEIAKGRERINRSLHARKKPKPHKIIIKISKPKSGFLFFLRSILITLANLESFAKLLPLNMHPLFGDLFHQHPNLSLNF